MNSPAETLEGPLGEVLKAAWQVVISAPWIRGEENKGGFPALRMTVSHYPWGLPSITHDEQGHMVLGPPEQYPRFETEINLFHSPHWHAPKTQPPELDRIREAYLKMIAFLLADVESRLLETQSDKTRWDGAFQSRAWSYYSVTSSPLPVLVAGQGYGAGAALLENVWLAIKALELELDTVDADKTDRSEPDVRSLGVISGDFLDLSVEDPSERTRSLKAYMPSDTVATVHEAYEALGVERIPLTMFICEQRAGKGKGKREPGLDAAVHAKLSQLAKKYVQTVEKILPIEGDGSIKAEAKAIIAESLYCSTFNTTSVPVEFATASGALDSRLSDTSSSSGKATVRGATIGSDPTVDYDGRSDLFPRSPIVDAKSNRDDPLAGILEPRPGKCEGSFASLASTLSQK